MTKNQLDKMKSGLQEYRERLKSGEIQTVKLNPTERAKQNPRSKALAIRANCYECVGGDATPNWQREVLNCNLAEKCSLFPHRPYQHKGNAGLSDSNKQEQANFEEILDSNGVVVE